jgi:Ser/Thr protein kinase RdoA (MazF antagonist)
MRIGRALAQGEEMRVTKLQELGEMAAKLLATARKLPPGPERSYILREIGRFRSQIVALQEAGSRPARRRAEGEREIE